MNQRIFSLQSSVPTYEPPVACERSVLEDLILQQWKKITRQELEKTAYSKKKIALLIERKYGVHHALMENYLSNLERTLPITARTARR